MKDTTQTDKQRIIDEMQTALANIMANDAKFPAQITFGLAKLLKIFAEESDAATIANLRMQRRLLGLTWGLLFLTIALFAIAAIQTKVMIEQNTNANHKGNADANPSNTKKSP